MIKKKQENAMLANQKKLKNAMKKQKNAMKKQKNAMLANQI